MSDGRERPRVTLHYAQTLDGRIATRTGHSQWISCGGSLQLAHQLRAGHEAVMVGVGTVVSDDPRLTVRLVPGESPLRIVVDSTLRLPLHAQVLSDGAAPTLIATTGRAPAERRREIERRGVEALVVGQTAEGRVDLPDLLERLARRGIESLLIEGGSGLITSALHDGVVDQLIVCIAPKVIGAGIEAVGNLNIARMSEALAFTEASFSELGEDIIFHGQLAREQVPGAARRISGG